MYVLLTGRADDNRAPTGISIDQYLAKTAANQATPLPSVQTGLSGGNFRVSAAAAYEPLPPIKNPADAFSHMFQGFVSGDATNVGPDPEFLKLRAQKKSILDFAAREIGATRAQLGATDRERLDVHLESVREIERRLDLAEGSIASSTNSCGGVHSSIASDNLSGNGLPTGTDSRGNPLPWYENSVNIPFAIGLHLDMLVAALACGRTNVATFMAGGGTFVWQYPWITEIPSAVPDGANTSVTVSAGNHSISHIPARTAPYHEYVIRWYSEIYSDFAAKLDQIQERDGQTLLDHSFVGWSSENGDGPGHNTKDNHWVTWGSAGGYFNTGRYFDFHSSGGRTVNDLYLDVAEAFGSPTASFGDPAFVNGPLEGLRG